MHDLDFADAFRPPQFTVLGLPLLDYSIGHELVLWQRRNPLVIFTSEYFDGCALSDRVHALTQAVLICCKRVPKWAAGGIWAWRIRNVDVGAEVKKFRYYRAAGSRDLPTVKQPRDSKAPFHYFGGPELARLINYVTTSHAVMIKTHFGGSPLNFPLGLARMLYLVAEESAGSVWIKNHNDYKDEGRMKAFEQAHSEPTLAVGEEAVQKLTEEWNKAHPEAQFILPGSPKKEEK
jgi:hypothetical protein